MYTVLVVSTHPDFIITHDPNDYMPDHVATSRLVFDTCFAATVPGYPAESTKRARLVPVYYMDTLAGVNFNPTEYVDVSEYIDTKLDMLRCHASQIVWMRDHDHIDFPDMVRTCCRYRGYQCGADYAEGFRQAIAAGIRKINYYSYMSKAGYEAAKAVIESNTNGYLHDVEFAAMKAMVEEM